MGLVSCDCVATPVRLGPVIDRGQDPSFGTMAPSRAGVTQLAECQLPKLNVAGSNPVSRSNPLFNLVGNIPPPGGGRSGPRSVYYPATARAASIILPGSPPSPPSPPPPRPPRYRAALSAQRIGAARSRQRPRVDRGRPLIPGPAATTGLSGRPTGRLIDPPPVLSLFLSPPGQGRKKRATRPGGGGTPSRRGKRNRDTSITGHRLPALGLIPHPAPNDTLVAPGRGPRQLAARVPLPHPIALEPRDSTGRRPRTEEPWRVPGPLPLPHPDAGGSSLIRGSTSTAAPYPTPTFTLTPASGPAWARPRQGAADAPTNRRIDATVEPPHPPDHRIVGAPTTPRFYPSAAAAKTIRTTVPSAPRPGPPGHAAQKRANQLALSRRPPPPRPPAERSPLAPSGAPDGAGQSRSPCRPTRPSQPRGTMVSIHLIQARRSGRSWCSWSATSATQSGDPRPPQGATASTGGVTRRRPPSADRSGPRRVTAGFTRILPSILPTPPPPSRSGPRRGRAGPTSSHQAGIAGGTADPDPIAPPTSGPHARAPAKTSHPRGLLCSSDGHPARRPDPPEPPGTDQGRAGAQVPRPGLPRFIGSGSETGANRVAITLDEPRGGSPVRIAPAHLPGRSR